MDSRTGDGSALYTEEADGSPLANDMASRKQFRSRGRVVLSNLPFRKQFSARDDRLCSLDVGHFSD